VGLVSSVNNTMFAWLVAPDDALAADGIGRWDVFGRALVNPTQFNPLWSPGKPDLLKHVRLGAFQADFRITSTAASWLCFVFNAKDQDEYNVALIYYSTTEQVPFFLKVTDGGVWTAATGWSSGSGMPVASLGDDLWGG